MAIRQGKVPKFSISGSRCVLANKAGERGGGGGITDQRVHIDWRWPLSRIRSVMMVFSAQLAESGGALTTTPFTLSTSSTPPPPVPVTVLSHIAPLPSLWVGYCCGSIRMCYREAGLLSVHPFLKMELTKKTCPVQFCDTLWG